VTHTGRIDRSRKNDHGLLGAVCAQSLGGLAKMKQTIPSSSFKEVLALGFKRKGISVNYDERDFLKIYTLLLGLSRDEGVPIPAKETRWGSFNEIRDFIVGDN
jgi:hypothetical protein